MSSKKGRYLAVVRPATLYKLFRVSWLLYLGATYGSLVWGQCVMCRTQLESNLTQSESRHAAEGINHGVLYLMAIPYLSLVVLAYAWYRKAKRKRNA